MRLDLSQEFRNFERTSKDSGHIQTTEKIITIFKRKNVNVRDYINRKIGDYHETLLHFHARVTNIPRNKEKCVFLLQCGADINSTDNFCKTPLHNAVVAGNYELVKLLLNKLAYVNAQNQRNNTPLYNAVLKGFDICSILLNHGADPNIASDDNENSLSQAVACGSTEIFVLFLQHGGDIISDEPQDGKRVIDLVNASNNERVYNLCLQNLKNSEG